MSKIAAAAPQIAKRLAAGEVYASMGILDQLKPKSARYPDGASTSYEAAVMTGSQNAEAARAVLKALANPAGKAAFVSGGVE